MRRMGTSYELFVKTSRYKWKRQKETTEKREEKKQK